MKAEVKELIVKRLNPSGYELSAVSYELINYGVIYSKAEEKIKNPRPSKIP